MKRLWIVNCALVIACGLLAGCSSLNLVVNLGGTVNLVPVTKVVRDGTMSSATTADEANPSTTTVQIPLPGVK